MECAMSSKVPLNLYVILNNPLLSEASKALALQTYTVWYKIWNKDVADCHAAWHRTKVYFEHFYKGEAREVLLKIVSIRIALEERTQKSSFYVSPSGRIVPVSEIGAKE